MSITNTPQQLLLIKQLFDDACILAEHQDELSLTKALILLDLSIEQMLNQVIRDCSLNTASNVAFGRRDTTWQKIWDAANQAINDKGFKLIHHRDLLSLHEVRNMAQHNATIPTQIEVQRYIEPACESLSSLFADIYKTHFQNFTLWDLIENEDLKQILKDSEYALNKQEIHICIVGCNLAYGLIILAIRNHTRFRNFHTSSFLDKFNEGTSARFSLGVQSQIQQATKQLNEAIKRGVMEFRKEIMQEIEFLENEMVSIGIGLPIMDTRKFQKIGNSVSVSSSYSGDISVKIKKRDITEQDARFMLNYLSKLIHLIDESYSGVLEDVKLKKSLREQAIWKKIEENNQSN